MEPVKPTLLSSTKITFPDKAQVVQKSAAFTATDSAVYAQFQLGCTNLPIGTKLTLAVGDPGPQPPIYIPPTIVTTSPTFTLGIMSSIPANYSTNFYFNAEMPPGAFSSPEMSVVVQLFSMP